MNFQIFYFIGKLMLSNNWRDIYDRIISRENYSNKIRELVTMLEHTRDVTLSEISNLNQSDLDFLPNGISNTIDSLLSHIAAMEFVHQVISFEKRDLTESEYLK